MTARARILGDVRAATRGGRPDATVPGPGAWYAGEPPARGAGPAPARGSPPGGGPPRADGPPRGDGPSLAADRARVDGPSRVDGSPRVDGTARAGRDPGDGIRPPRVRERRGPRRADVVALFAERAAARHAVVRHVAAADLAIAMAAMLWAVEAKRVAVPADLPGGWHAGLDGVRVLPDDPALENAVLAEADGVVTGCGLAIAGGGTIVLDGGRAQGRRELTLLPHHHLCVVHADQIVATVAEAVGRLDPYRPLSWIGGPPPGHTLGLLLVDD